MARGLPSPTGRPGHPSRVASTRPRVTGPRRRRIAGADALGPAAPDAVKPELSPGCRPPGSQPVTSRRKSAPQSLHTYVLDTSVLISDPAAFLRFAEHQVVLPLIVISELESMRAHPELGYFARQS